MRAQDVTVNKGWLSNCFRWIHSFANTALYRFCNNLLENSRFRAALYRFSPTLLAQFRCRMMTGKWLNLKDPKTFTEKLIWLMLYWRHPLKTRCADKYTMRLFAQENGLEHILPELFGVYENSSEIDFSILPQRFVLKCTHGCGFNIICKDKNSLDTYDTCRKLDEWLKIDYSRRLGEVHYEQMKGRIICEEYLDDSVNELPPDYKIFCFDGKAHSILLCTERVLNEGLPKFDMYDVQWNRLPYISERVLGNAGIPRPEALEEMIEAAEKLSKPFPFVRMDFYCIRGKGILGEMTFTPCGCIIDYHTSIADHVLGELIRLPAPLTGC